MPTRSQGPMGSPQGVPQSMIAATYPGKSTKHTSATRRSPSPARSSTPAPMRLSGSCRPTVGPRPPLGYHPRATTIPFAARRRPRMQCPRCQHENAADAAFCVARHEEARKLRPGGSGSCRVLRWFALSFGDAATIGVPFDGDDVRVVDEPIDEGGGDRRIGEDRRPVAEG
jgi:hypothetical protein